VREVTVLYTIIIVVVVVLVVIFLLGRFRGGRGGGL
jgi:preprotein translocase subunit SecG